MALAPNLKLQSHCCRETKEGNWSTYIHSQELTGQPRAEGKNEHGSEYDLAHSVFWHSSGLKCKERYTHGLPIFPPQLMSSSNAPVAF